MLQADDKSKLTRERSWRSIIRPVADDLRLLDLQLLAHHFSRGQIGNVESIVDASCELYFRDQSLKFCRLGSVELAWGKRPVVKIDLRFSYKGITAAFLLMLDADHASLELSYMSVEGGWSENHQTKLLERRLREARRGGSLVSHIAGST